MKIEKKHNQMKNKRLKFRFYDFKTKIIYPTTSVAFTKKQGILMQNTGFSDKNNVDIYIDDIITIANKLAYQVQQSSSGEFYIYGKHYTSLERIFELDTQKEIEIIGNIHENSDLLN